MRKRMNAAQRHSARILLLFTVVATTLVYLRFVSPLSAQQLTSETSVSRTSDQKETFQSGLADDDSEANRIAKSRSDAANLLQLVLRQLVSGSAFDAKVREIVWTTGREVIGVGTYEQAGDNTGRFNLQLTMHDGKGKHRLQQISDGRLVWTRSEISEVIKLTRVEVGKLPGWAAGPAAQQPIPARLQVGAWAEMLSNLQRDYELSVTTASLKQKPVFVITGQLRDEKRKAVLEKAKRTDWPMLYPTQLRVAVNAEPNAETNFGLYLPVRIEFWSDPVADSSDQVAGIRESKRRLITLVELYSIRPITTPSAERFRFDNVNVDFTNETDRYIEIHDAKLTQRPTAPRR
ncbi:hypothetical protein N9018_01545 [Rhodopirellula sp.]|nr:hypothetical protein [Rhodopirellula sp.]MDB4476867.1 hypothetical protein [Rhodopirellula sp.]